MVIYSEIEEKLVVYCIFYGDYDFWVRLFSMFIEMIEVEGDFLFCFCYIDNL